MSDEERGKNAGWRNVALFLGVWALLATAIVVWFVYSGLVKPTALLRDGQLDQFESMSRQIAENLKAANTDSKAMMTNFRSANQTVAESSEKMAAFMRDADTAFKGLTVALSSLAARPDLSERLAEAELPEEIRESLRKYYDFFSEPEKWPVEADARNLWRNETTTFFNTLDDGQKVLLFATPEFIRMSWGFELMNTLDSRLEDDEATRLEMAEALSALLDDVPPGLSRSLLAFAEAKLSEINDETVESRRSRALTSAETALKNGRDFDQAFAMLLEFDDPESVELRNRLEKNVANEAVKAQADQYGRDLQALLALKDDDALKTIGIMQLYQNTSDLALSCLQTGNSEVKKAIGRLRDDIQQAVDNLGRKQREKERKALRDYQSWALKQLEEWEKYNYDKVYAQLTKDINSFNPKNKDMPVSWDLYQTFPETIADSVLEHYEVKIHNYSFNHAEIKHQIFAKANVTGSSIRSFKGQVEIATAIHKEAMKRYLMTIDTRYLEAPVLELYNQAWAKGWDKIDDEAKLDIANASATVEKRVP